MNNSIQLFNYGENPVRIIQDDNGEVWFVAKDVCDILDIANSRDALSTLDDDEKNTVAITDGNKKKGNPNMNIINESGFYTLVFKSIKPEAREFRRWVTGTVLPQIRKTGSFTVEQPEQTQPKQKTLPDSTLQSEIVNIKRRIAFIQDILKKFMEFECSFMTRDQFYQHIVKWPAYMNDDGKDLRHMADMVNMFREFTDNKIRSLEEKLKALETIAKF